MKRAVALLATIVAITATAAPAQDPLAEGWELIGGHWSVLPSSIGRLLVGARPTLVARVKNDSTGDAADNAGEYYVTLPEVFCRASRASLALTKRGVDKSEVLHFSMAANSPVSTLARRMCAKAARVSP